MRNAWIGLAVGVTLLTCLVRKAHGATRLEDERPLVATTFYPMTYFAERIGAADVRVVCPLPADADPSSWTPDADAIRLYQKADLILLNGAGFERWTKRVSLPRASRVDTSRSFKDRWLMSPTSTTHSHGLVGTHSHVDTNGHTWLDPVLAQAQARAVLGSLSRLMPHRGPQLEERFEALSNDLARLDQQFRALGAVEEGTTLLASHPCFDYLGDRYGWPIVNVHLDPTAPLDQIELRQVEDELERSVAHTVLWKSQPTASKVAQLRDRFGLTSIVVSTCEHSPAATDPPSKDFIETMRGNIERLRVAFPEPEKD